MRIGVAILLLVGSVAAAPREAHPWREATEAKGRHYVVRTNTFPEVARDLIATLDRSYPLFEDRFGPLDGRARLPMRVHLHRSREEYLEEGDGIAGALGHFDPSLDTCVLVWRGGIGEAGWPIAVHEACHQYIRRRYGRIRLPSWYSEGIACWFEGLQTQRTHDRVSRLRFAAAVAALRDGQARIDSVLEGRSLVRSGRLEVSGLTPARYYGLAWSLVHFLATDATHRNGFRRFELRLFAARPTTRECAAVARRILEEECGPLAELEVAWREHIRALRAPPILVAPAVYRWDLASENPYTRYTALRNLQRAQLTPAVADRALAALADDDILVRVEATRLFARRARDQIDWPKGAVATLLASCDWGDAELKRVSIEALAHPAMGEAVPRLLDESEERGATARTLAAIGDPRGFPRLRGAALDTTLSTATRAACIRALAADPEARTVLMTATGARERSVRHIARASLMRLDGRVAEVQAAMAAEERERPPAGSSEAIRLGGPRGLVRIALDPSGDRRDRVRACVLLGALRAHDSIPALRRLCRPGVDSTVRLEALRTLVRITGKTQGFRPAQPPRDREAVFRRWAAGS